MGWPLRLWPRTRARAGNDGRPWNKGAMRRSGSIDRHFGALRLVFASLLVSVVLAACGAPGGGGIGPGAPRITGSTGTVKVAVLLPISSSGSTPAVAKALKQAAELALFDFDN